MEEWRANPVALHSPALLLEGVQTNLCGKQLKTKQLAVAFG